MSAIHDEQRELFLNALGGGTFSFRTFDDSGMKRKHLQCYPDYRGDMFTLAATLEEKNKQGAGVFIMPNDGGQTDKSIKRIRACYVDMDADNASEMIDKAMEFNPHITVQSSFGRFHAYWLVHGFHLSGTGIRCSEFRQVQRNLVYHLNGDKSVVNESRVMRMPGFYHNKCKDGASPFMTEVLYVGGHSPYSYADMVDMFPPKPVKQFSAPKYIATKKGEFRGEYGCAEGGRNVHIYRRGCGAKAAGRDYEREMRLENDACMPPLGDNELLGIIKQVGLA